jgi:cytochrome c biogenesis protein CcdA
MSFGTLLIPIWLLMAPGKLRLSNLLVYLGTVVLFYFLIGILLVFGADMLLSQVGTFTESGTFLLIQLVIGIALFVISFFIDSKKAKERVSKNAREGTGRLFRWRARAMGEDGSGSLPSLIGLALTAAVIELMSMLPYLAAIGIIAASGMDTPKSMVILLPYCLVMVLPALILALGRLFARERLDQPLRRIEQWLTLHSADTVAWIVGIVGFVLATHAFNRLGLYAGLDQAINSLLG